METLDFPLIAEARANLRLLAITPDLPILERKMFYAKSIHQFAAAFLALWVHKGTKPSGEPANDFQRSGMALAQSVYEGLQNVSIETLPPKIRHDVWELTKCQRRLSTDAFSGTGGCSFLEAPPSKAALRERVEYNAKRGSTHVGTRRVSNVKRTVKPFDSRYPAHW